MKPTRTFTTCFILCSMLLLAFSNIFNRQPSESDLDSSNSTTKTVTNPLISDSNLSNSEIRTKQIKPIRSIFRFKGSEKPTDKLLGGLLTADFDAESCSSRYESLSYRKPSPFKPSKHLISELRNYETLHKNCGPNTKAYKRAIDKLTDDDQESSYREECQYIVWIPLSGLGNRILSLVSVFLYAVLTKRVMLVDQRTDITDLFCEPFPSTSWLLPFDFPFTNQFDRYHWHSPRSFGNMMKHQVINSSIERITSYLYLHLVHDYTDFDQMFFCEKNQNLLTKVPWLMAKSDNYFIPSLWLIPSFQSELAKLFLQQDTVFHHLARYLIHPTNQVWGLITRFHNTYLSRADEKLGIQIRVLLKLSFIFGLKILN